jgi:hypothetical protein
VQSIRAMSDQALDLTPTRSFPTPLEYAGGIAAVLPFFLRLSYSSSESGYRDYVSILSALMMLFAAALSAFYLSGGRTHELSRRKRTITLAFLVAGGLFHLLRGYGRI